MSLALRRVLYGLPLLLLVACSSTYPTAPPADTAPQMSTNTALFDPTTSTIPLPNILATATAADPLAGRAANTPMTPPEALAYVNKYEMGSTNAVAGINAPIYLRFAYPVDPATATAANIKVFQLTPDAAGTENNPLGFTDVSAMFTYQYAAGSTDLFVFPNFPLLPGTRYLYVVTNRVKDAATGGAVISSVYFEYLKSTTPLTGSTAALEPIRANAMSGSNILLSGYAKVMDDLIAASATTTISSRSSIALMGRFITTGAGFIVPDPASPNTRIPVESALRAFAAGAALGGLPGKTWTNSINVQATFNKNDPDPTKTVAAFWLAATGSSAAPPTLGQVVLGTINSADLSIDPVVANANATTIDLSAVTGAWNPAAAVVKPFRATNGALIGFYHVTRTVPFIYLAPDAAAPAGGYPLVIYQHGLGSKKETVLGMAQTLTGLGRSVVAIDAPLHNALAVPGHTTGDVWIQDFLALGAPLAGRTNLQQAAFNLNRLELTVATGGFAMLGAKMPAFASKPRYVALSLGSIIGAYYLASNTTLATTGLPYTQTTLDGDMKGYLSVAGSRIAYLLQNSPYYGPVVDAGLAAKGIVKNSPTYHQFFQVTQSVVDPVDPATVTTPLATGLPSRLSGRVAIQEAIGDQVIANAYTRYLGNALGGREILGSAGAAVAPGFKQLAYTAGGTPNHAAGVPSQFMLTLSGSNPVPKVANAAVTAADPGPKEGYFQFDQAGISHSSLLDPSNPVNIGLLQKQMAYFLGANGGFGVVGTTLVVDPTQGAPGLPIAAPPAEDIQAPAVWRIFGY